MTRRLVALLTQERRSNLEHVHNRSSMRVVANGAVFLDRSVLIHEGALEICVTFVTGQIDRLLVKHGFIVPMWVMATAAGHFAFENRMVRR